MDRKRWEPLQRYESRDYLTRHYKRLHGGSLSAQKAHEIGACFTQGREYFLSASTASETVKPLLLYYGVASLSTGATLLKEKSKREANLKPSHGLSTVEWSNTLKDGISDVLSLKIQCCKGLFSEFASAMGNAQSYCWRMPNKNSGHFRNDFGEIKFLSDKSTISLGDLLSRETKLLAEYKIANDGWGNADIGTVVAMDSSLRIHFTIIQNTDGEEMITNHQFPSNASVSLQPNPLFRHIPQMQTVCIEIPATGEDRKKVAPLAIDQDKEIGWIIRPLPNGDNIIDIHRMFMEAYILGMLSRYFPSKWISLLRSEKGDIARSVILAAIARIEDHFPELFRDHLPN